MQQQQKINFKTNKTKSRLLHLIRESFAKFQETASNEKCDFIFNCKTSSLEFKIKVKLTFKKS